MELIDKAFIQSKFQLFWMSSNQVELSFMLSKLKDMDQKIGGNQKKKRVDSEFDFLQDQFLARRHKVQKYQDIVQKQGGFNKSNANAGYQIRQGIIQMKQILEKLKQEHRRLTKKKKDTPQILQRKRKIVQNCQLLLKDIEDRETGGVAKNKAKTVTLTDLKAKLLHEIDQNNDAIHEKADKEDKFNENLDEDKEQIDKWKKKDEQIEVMVDEIIDGVKGLKGKVVKMNQAQDTINQKTNTADQKVGKLQNRIKGDNKKLKKIIQQFKPNRCCTYLALFLLLVGLVVCVIKLLI